MNIDERYRAAEDEAQLAIYDEVEKNGQIQID